MKTFAVLITALTLMPATPAPAQTLRGSGYHRQKRGEYTTDGISIIDEETGQVVDGAQTHPLGKDRSEGAARYPRRPGNEHEQSTGDKTGETNGGANGDTAVGTSGTRESERAGETAGGLPEAPAAETRRFNVAGQLTPLGLYVPFKYGLSASYKINDRWSATLEGLTGSFGANFYIANLGSIEERRLSALLRHKPGTKYFQLIYGLSHQRTSIDVGSDITSRFSGGTLPGEYRVLSVESITANLGFGHHWVSDTGVSVGIDWAVLYWPIANTSVKSDVLEVAEGEDRNAASNALDILKRVPSLALLNLSVGYSF